MIQIRKTLFTCRVVSSSTTGRTPGCNTIGGGSLAGAGGGACDLINARHAFTNAPTPRNPATAKNATLSSFMNGYLSVLNAKKPVIGPNDASTVTVIVVTAINSRSVDQNDSRDPSNVLNTYSDG